MLNSAPVKHGFWDHLSELRGRLIWCVIAVLTTSTICLNYHKILWQFLLDPLPANQKVSLINVAPTEAIILDFKVCVLAGVLIASPLLFWHAYRFIAPGLFTHEKKLILPVILGSSVFFVSGSLFAFKIIIPLFLNFLQAYSEGIAKAQWTQSNYTDFVLQMAFAFALIFQMPVVTYLLARLGLITGRFLWDQMRIAIVIIFIVAGILTPPDVVSQLIMAIPMVAIYIISIAVAYIFNSERANA